MQRTRYLDPAPRSYSNNILPIVIMRQQTFLKTKAILIVEDSPDLRGFLLAHFRTEGYQVFEAENGLEGLKKASECNPDLVITDLNMPIMDGAVMTRALREHGHFNHIPIIVLTAGGAQHAAAAKQAGADIVLHKPTPLDFITSSVRDLLRESVQVV